MQCLENAETLRFLFLASLFFCDFSAFFFCDVLAFFSGDFCSKACDFALCDFTTQRILAWKFQSRRAILRIIFNLWALRVWSGTKILTIYFRVVRIGENQKGTAGRGREKKCHDNLRQTSRQFTTFYDNLRHFMTISVSLFHWHKTS